MRAVRWAAVPVGLACGVWALVDYRRWRSLGPGGVPSNPAGWVVVSLLRLRGRDPFVVRGPQDGAPHPAVAGLPWRETARPVVAAHPIPHRTRSQTASSLVTAFRAVLDELTARDDVELRTSGWERHHQAAWAVDGTEIAHVHPSDGSGHVVLTAADARVVVGRGWGELHPLAGVGFGLPEHYTLLYPPRDESDLGHVGAILTAAADRVRRT